MVIETGATIFVVDDDELVRDSLKTLIMTAGFRVEAFGSAREFLANVAHKSSGILVLDVRMPGMTGLELLQRVRAADPDMPFIMVTGNSDMDAVKAAGDLDVSAYIRKPYSPQQFGEKLMAVLDKL